MAALPKILYENRFADATPVASSTDSGLFNVLNLRDWRPYTWWKPTSLPATVTVDCGSSKAADYLVVWGHDLFTNGCTIEVRGSTDNFSASDVLVATSTPANNNGFLVLFNSTSFRYWRVRITGTTPPSLAIVSVGVRLQMPVGLRYSEFDPIGRKVIGQGNRSEAGHPLGKVIDFEEWRQPVSFDFVLQSWLRSVWDPAWRAHLRSTPFVFAWETDSHASELFLVQADNEFESPHTTPIYADLEFEIFGLYP